MIQTIVFSRNRAAQLDLLLRSLEDRAPQLQPIQVIYRSDTGEFTEGYQTCQAEHPNTIFFPEAAHLSGQVEDLLQNWGDTNNVAFLCDDDLIVRPFHDLPEPESLLANMDKLLCVSLRLGQNTNRCYPYDREQTIPEWEIAFEDARLWSWEGKDADWGYPGSLDGHVFRRQELLDMLVYQPYLSAFRIYSNPNELEELLNSHCGLLGRPMMACYTRSVLTGVPINRVNTTHPNRFGQQHPLDQVSINAQYRAGRRFVLGALIEREITGAHTELPLVLA